MDHLPATDSHPRKRKAVGDGAAFRASAPHGSKKFYFCRRQNDAARPRRNPPERASRESKTGREKNLGTKMCAREEGERGGARPTRGNASQTDTESEATGSPPSPSHSRETSHNIAKTTVFASGGFRRYICDSTMIARF